MLKLCLFDLDDTLVRTRDLKELREAGKGTDSREYRSKIAAAFSKCRDRMVYGIDHLDEIREKFPSLKVGVFTRSPRAYAESVLSLAYPSFEWDGVIAYEDVTKTKPCGEGIHKAMKKFGIRQPEEALMVGNSTYDIGAAYNAGIVAVLDKST